MASNLVTPEKTFTNSESYIYKVEKNSNSDIKTTKDSRSPSLEEIESINNLITRKTLRGRKEKMMLPKDKQKCEICLQFSDFSKENLISCSRCKCLFHKSCYDQFQLNEKSSYICIRCFFAEKTNKPINDYKCFICGNSNGVLKINTQNKSFYHEICVNFLNEFREYEEEHHICRENIRKWRYKNSCRYCGEKLSKSKAVVKCKNPNCKEFYHIPCAIEKGMIFDLDYMKNFYKVSKYNEIPFYCSNHNKKLAFMYKTKVTNCNYANYCEKGLFGTEYNLYKEENKKTFLDCFNENNEEKYNQNNSNLIEDDYGKIKCNFLSSNLKTIIEEQNMNDEITQDTPVKKDNETKQYNDECMNMEIDDSFENYKRNDPFQLDFQKIIEEGEDSKIKNCFFLKDEFCCKSRNIYLDNDSYEMNEDNSLIASKRNSFDSLSYNI